MAVILSILLELVDTALQGLEGLEKDAETGVWLPVPEYSTSGLPAKWGPLFTAGASDRGYIALKITGRMTFAMTAPLKDRMTNIVTHMNGEDNIAAMIWDLSAVPELDYTCLLAIRDILSAAKPGKRNTLKDGVRSTSNCKGVAVYIVGANKKCRACLTKFGFFGRSLIYGEWPLFRANTIDTAIADFMGGNRTRMDRTFPYPWNTPKSRPFDFPVGHVETGEDDKQYKIIAMGNGLCKWVYATPETFGAAEPVDAGSAGAGAGAELTSASAPAPESAPADPAQTLRLRGNASEPVGASSPIRGIFSRVGGDPSEQAGAATPSTTEV